MLDDSGLHFRMPRKIEVQTIGPCVHQSLQPRRARIVLRLQSIGIDEDLHAQIAPHRTLALALCLGQSSHSVNVVCFDTIEIVFGLGIDHAEHGIGIRLTRDVRDAPIVADDADAPGLLLPALELLRLGTCGRLRDESEGYRDHEN